MSSSKPSQVEACTYHPRPQTLSTAILARMWKRRSAVAPGMSGATQAGEDQSIAPSASFMAATAPAASTSPSIY